MDSGRLRERKHTVEAPRLGRRHAPPHVSNSNIRIRSAISLLLAFLLPNRLGVLLGPLARRLDGGLFVLLPGLGDFGGEWVVGVGGAKEGLDGEEDGADLEGGGPVVCAVGGSRLANGPAVFACSVLFRGDRGVLQRLR